jgi:hypothetical protein
MCQKSLKWGLKYRVGSKIVCAVGTVVRALAPKWLREWVYAYSYCTATRRPVRTMPLILFWGVYIRVGKSRGLILPAGWWLGRCE